MEEVIHNSRLYSILVRERLGDKQEEEELFSPWSRHGFVSEIKSVQKTLSRKFSSLRRKRKKEDVSSHIKNCDNNDNKSAIKDSIATGVNDDNCDDSKLNYFSCHEIRKTTRTRKSSNCSVTANTCTGGKSLSRIFGSFRQSFRQAKSDESENTLRGATKVADQSHEEIISGRDSAYFSLTLTSSESENEEAFKPGDESQDSLKGVIAHHDHPSFQGKRHQGCQTEPKKNVTLLLPNTRTPSRPFGIHLQTETVRIQPHQHEHHHLHPEGDISYQVDTIVQVAKVHLLSNFPKFHLSINIIFSPSTKCFMSLNSSTIGDLMFHLNRILFSPHLQTIITWEVSLFIIIKFLSKLINFLHSTTGLCHNTDISCVKYFQKCLLKDFCDYKTQKILVKVQQEFISIWMCILL